MHRLIWPNTPVDPVAKIEPAGIALSEQSLHDGRLGAPVSHDDNGRRPQKGADQLKKFFIKYADFPGSVLVRVLFRLAVQPHDLAFAEDIKFVEVAGAAIDFANRLDMGLTAP